MRLSAGQNQKLTQELTEYRSRMQVSTQESETFKMKISKLMTENTSMGEEIRGVQENLRLSANQVAKLTNELKITCNENEEMKRRLGDMGEMGRKIAEYENKIALLSQ